MRTPVNPLLVAFFAFNPATPGALASGSWGGTVIATIPGQAFNVILSEQFAGGLTAAQAELLHITPCVHEVSTGQTITPLTQGFNIDFGVPLVRTVTIKVEKLVSE